MCTYSVQKAVLESAPSEHWWNFFYLPKHTLNYIPIRTFTVFFLIINHFHNV